MRWWRGCALCRRWSDYLDVLAALSRLE